MNLFEKHKHDGRVILPLLKSLALLMNRLCIEHLTHDASFSSSLLNHLVDEESTCKDVHRLAAIIDVALGLLGTAATCQKVRTYKIHVSFWIIVARSKVFQSECRQC